MTSTSEPPLLFVYGSLRRGGRHHGKLAGAVCLAACRTAPRYRLLKLHGYAALSPGGDKAIAGELYPVADRLLTELDRFEGEDYERGFVELDDGRVVQAYLLAESAVSESSPFEGESWPDD